MLLRKLLALHGLLDEIGETGSTGGGAASDVPDLNVDIDATSDAIGAELFGEDKDAGAKEELDSGSATPPEKKESKVPANETPEAKAGREAREKVAKETSEKAAAVKTAREALKAKNTPDLDKKTDDEVLALHKAGLPQPKAAPKSWAKEKAAIFATLPPEAQAYIEQREAEVEEGFKKYGAESIYAKSVRETMQPYEALLTAQGVKDHTTALKAVMNAHYVLSTNPPEKKAEFFAALAKNYQVDMTAAMAAYGKATPAESDEAKALRLRLDAMDQEKRQERERAFAALKAQAAAEVEAFASDPKNVYFNELQREVALLLNGDPNLSIPQAYEQAIWLNPVVREKEQARLSKESAEKARLEAEEKAKAALKAKGTKIKGDERERASPDPLGSIDDTLRETFHAIKNRQE